MNELKDKIKILLNKGLDKPKVQDVNDIECWNDLQGQNISVGDAIIIKQIQKALKGDTKSAEFILQATDSGDKLSKGLKLINEQPERNN